MRWRWGLLPAALVLLAIAGGAGADTWTSDSDIVSGLGDVGTVSTPTIFNMDGTWYLISGSYNAFYGYDWTGSAWQSNATIISGLSSGQTRHKPNVFQKDGTWYLISGNMAGVFDGFNWTGSAWQSDTNIISGLGDVGKHSRPYTFQKDSTWHLISGAYDGNFYGYNWAGSTWQSDPAIVSGLPDIGSYSQPTIFQMGGVWYLISGFTSGTFIGYNWTGSTWQSDSMIISGLPDVGSAAQPDVFQKDGTWYLIAGEGDGVFNGFNSIPHTPDPVNLQHTKDTPNKWVNHTWNVGTNLWGTSTDSFNVSINGTWYHGTTNPYYNNTGLVDWGDWSNITVYAYNNTYGLSYSSVSEDAQILPTLTPHNDFTGDNQLILSPTDRHFAIEFKCTSDMNVKTWTWNGVDTSSETSNSIETTAIKYLDSWKGEVSVKASNDYAETEEITWEYDITPPSYWFDPYYGQRNHVLVYSGCGGEGIFRYYVKIEHVNTINCIYSDCRDLFFHDTRYGGTLPYFTTRADGSMHRTTDETVYVRMTYLTSGEQMIYMYSQCNEESGTLRTNQFGGYAILPGTIEKEFYCIPPCDDSGDLYVCPSSAGVTATMNVEVNESGSCTTNYLSGDISSSVDWGCLKICGSGLIYIYPTVAYAGTACSAYDQDLLLIQPFGGAWVGVYIKSKQYHIVEDDDCWVGIGGHNTPIPTDGGTTTDSFSIDPTYDGGITSRLGLYSSWSMSPNGGADIYEIYYEASQDQNPCGVETIFGYHDYMIIVLYDNNGNLITNANVAIYDTTDNTYIQKWDTEENGIIMVPVEDYGTHTLQITVGTFDGVFVHDIHVDPEGGVINKTIPLNYNLKVYPVDQNNKPVFDVFAGLAEYTPLNPGAFWGMDLSDRGYVPVTNCSGFAMCDIIAEKEGYADFRVEALNWTSKSALVKDYRHNVVMEEE